jgi:hypothetical protein
MILLGEILFVMIAAIPFVIAYAIVKAFREGDRKLALTMLLSLALTLGLYFSVWWGGEQIRNDPRQRHYHHYHEG